MIKRASDLLKALVSTNTRLVNELELEMSKVLHRTVRVIGTSLVYSSLLITLA
jgi:hypothetical protein